MTTKEFTDTFLPLADSLYRVAYYMLESKNDAEDAVQDLFARLWTSRDKLPKVRNPKSYCVTLMRNLCLDRIRKASGKSAAPLDESVTDGSATDNLAIGNETRRRVGEAISELSERQRKVLRMRVFEDLTNEEISVRTGMSDLTVRVSLSQARKKLRKILDV